MAQMNGTGKGGKTFQDREKAAKVRNSLLDCIQLVIDDDPKVEAWSEYKKRIVEKMSSSILPRLNEHSGPDGDAIPISGVEITVRK